MRMGGGILDDAARMLGADRDTVRVAELVNQILAHELRQAPGQPAQAFRPGLLIPYLEAYRFHQENPWVVPTGLVGAIALIFFLGRASR